MRGPWEHLPDSLKHVLDVAAVAALLGNLISMLPAASTVLTFIWCGLRIYESVTVQGWLKRRRAEKEP